MKLWRQQDGGGRRTDRLRGAKRTEDGRIDEDNEAEQSRPSLWPIRIKLAGPWQRLGRTVGHEERGGGEVWGGGVAKGENIPVIKTK